MYFKIYCEDCKIVYDISLIEWITKGIKCPICNDSEIKLFSKKLGKKTK
jgi:anaerobic ribonucleoside-triphosphate reductase